MSFRRNYFEQSRLASSSQYSFRDRDRRRWPYQSEASSSRRDHASSFQKGWQEPSHYQKFHNKSSMPSPIPTSSASSSSASSSLGRVPHSAPRSQPSHPQRDEERPSSDIRDQQSSSSSRLLMRGEGSRRSPSSSEAPSGRLKVKPSSELYQDDEKPHETSTAASKDDKAPPGTEGCKSQDRALSHIMEDMVSSQALLSKGEQRPAIKRKSASPPSDTPLRREQRTSPASRSPEVARDQDSFSAKRPSEKDADDKSVQESRKAIRSILKSSSFFKPTTPSQPPESSETPFQRDVGEAQTKVSPEISSIFNFKRPRLNVSPPKGHISNILEKVMLPPPRPSGSISKVAARKKIPEAPRISDKISWEYPTPMVEKEQEAKKETNYPRPPPAPMIKNEDPDFPVPMAGSEFPLNQESRENLLIDNMSTIPLLINKKKVPNPDRSVSKRTPVPDSAVGSESVLESREKSSNPTFSAEELEMEAEMWTSDTAENTPLSTRNKYSPIKITLLRDKKKESSESNNTPGSQVSEKSSVDSRKEIVLPEGWTQSSHASGVPIYFHEDTRTVTFSMPYILEGGTLSDHSPPAASIPFWAKRQSADKSKVTAMELKSYWHEMEAGQGHQEFYSFPSLNKRQGDIQIKIQPNSSLKSIFQTVVSQLHESPHSADLDPYCTVMKSSPQDLDVAFFLWNKSIFATGIGHTVEDSKKDCARNALKKMDPHFPFDKVKEDSCVTQMYKKFYIQVPLKDASLIEYFYTEKGKMMDIRKVPTELLNQLLEIDDNDIVYSISSTNYYPKKCRVEVNIPIKNKREDFYFPLNHFENSPKGISKSTLLKEHAAHGFIMSVFPFFRTWWDVVQVWIDDQVKKAEAKIQP